MKHTTKYVALDVHQEATAATVRDHKGRVIARSVLPTEEGTLLEFFRGMRGSIHVTFEEGTQAQWLHDLLVPEVDRVVVCDRRGERQRGNKGDRVDADQLSDLLRRGGLRGVYHGSPHRADLKELTRTYQNLVEDSMRVMQRLKALFRARAIRTPGKRVYDPAKRAEWLATLPDGGVRFRAQILYAELDVLRNLRPKAKVAMMAEARRDPAYAVLQTIPFFTSSEFVVVGGRPVRRKRQPLTRGLNRNHNPIVKEVFKGAAVAASVRPGPLQDFYHGMVERGMDEALARVTLARKLAAVTLRLWKKGEHFDPKMLTVQAH